MQLSMSSSLWNGRISLRIICFDDFVSILSPNVNSLGFIVIINVSVKKDKSTYPNSFNYISS